MKSMLGLAFVVVSALMSMTYAGTPREQLQIMVEQLQKTPFDNALRERVIDLARGMKAKPALPEEANKDFVRGAVFKSEAKSPSDYDLAISAYQEGLQAAPWDGDAYYNLSVVQELAGKFDDAIQSLKWSILASTPGSKEAEEAQNRIYAIEAKKELLQKQQLEREAVTRAQAATQTSPLERFKGVWILKESKDDPGIHVISVSESPGLGWKVSVGPENYEAVAVVDEVNNYHLVVHSTSTRGSITAYKYFTLALTGDDSGIEEFHQIVNGRRDESLDQTWNLVRTSR